MEGSISNDYWNALDALVGSSAIKLDRPKGSSHPKFSQTVYPLDYGYLEGSTSGDGHGIDVWLGSSGSLVVTGLVITVDLFKRDTEQKIICGCSLDEAEMIRDFHNVNRQHAALFWRDS